MAKTHKNHFTREQVEHPGVNHYVRTVSPSSISFTEEFKQYFYHRHSTGASARQIFSECGIDPDILGNSRIDGFRYTVRKYAVRDEGFVDNRAGNCRRPPSENNGTIEARVKRLEHELAYTRQEVEFLKKMQMADMEARRQWESKHRPQ